MDPSDRPRSPSVIRALYDRATAAHVLRLALVLSGVVVGAVALSWPRLAPGVAVLVLVGLWLVYRTSDLPSPVSIELQ
jgi:uncharacterized membrane protein